MADDKCCDCDCCKGIIDYDLDNLTTDTQLLPNKSEEITQEKLAFAFKPPLIYPDYNHLISYGDVPYEKIKDINDLCGKQGYKLIVKKGAFGNIHGLLLIDVYVNDQKSESLIYGYGSNENGQLGMDYNVGGENVYKELTEVKGLKEKMEQKFILWEASDFDFDDINVADGFSLLTIRYKNDAGMALYRFQMKKEDLFEIASGQCEESTKLSVYKEKFNGLTNGDIKKVVSFGDKIMILTNNNYLYMKGTLFDMTNANDFVLYRNFKENILDITIGINNCLLLAQNNQIFAIGHNEYGEFGIKETINNEYQPVNNIIKTNLFRKETAVKSEGEYYVNDYFVKKGLQRVKMTSGARHTLVLCSNGKLYSFGDNSDGQCCGLEKLVEGPTQVEFENPKEFIVDICCGFNHSIAKSISGRVFVWGDSSYDKLGFKETRIDQYSPVEISDLKIRNVVKMFAGPRQTAFFVSGPFNG